MLRRKLLRDMRRAMMQFLSIVLLCSLGTLLFSALDGVSRMAQATIDVYFGQNGLADFWVQLLQVDRDTLLTLRSIEGVEAVRARAVADLETTLPGEPTLNVAAYSGAMDINVPLVTEGEALSETDLRGCLLQGAFAQAHGLNVGDRVTVKWAQEEYSFIIRGTVYSPEYICVTDNVYPNPDEYGYMLINAEAMQTLPLTQVLVRIAQGADEEDVEHAIRQALPEALVMDRGAHPSTASAQSNADMFRNLTLVFPILAYAVAALIVMTTLTRMIDNQRLQLGTLKALGYSARKIRGHYLSYAVLPSLVGSVAGVVVGHTTLPYLIWALLIGQNDYPYRITPPISLQAWSMVALTVAMSMVICLITYQKSARETTAALLRPKAPKAGRRILLERVGFLWKRLGFNAKMVLRNLMRNRMRSIMSFVGVLSCNALIIASFGLQDSVNALALNHYTKTLSYDVRAELNDQAGDAHAYTTRLDAEAVECVMEKSVSAISQTQTRVTLLTVVQDQMTTLRLGENETLVQIASGGAAITRKLAQTLEVEEGDTLTLFFPGDDEPVCVTVVQTVENNVSQGLYMNRTTWESLRKGAFAPTAIQLRAPTEQCLSELSDMDEVDSLERPTEQMTELTNMLAMLTSIFVLLTLVALALAFVICYNMGLMNFSERVREYATLKVLGYHQKEIRRLIVGENAILSFLGVAVSIVPGVLLTGVVLLVCQTESLRYPSYTSAFSIVLSCVITYAFSLLIQMFLTRKVRSIDMVEALKSVE